MRLTRRIFSLCLLALFMAGTVANTVAAAKMSPDMMLQMSADAERSAGMADCPDCPPIGEAALDCYQVCMASFAAIIPAAAMTPRTVKPHVGISLISPAHGPLGPPDPFPPRTNAKA